MRFLSKSILIRFMLGNPLTYPTHDLVTQSCPTLASNPIDCSPPSSSVHGILPGKNPGVGCHALLQGILPTEGSNLGLLHCRQTLYRLSHLTHTHIPSLDRLP